MSKAAKLAVIAGRADTLVDTTNTGDVALNFGQYQNFILTFTGDVVFTNPTTEAIGQSGFIICIQDGTGSRTIAWNAVCEFTADTAPTATTTASKGDMFTFRYNGSKWLEVGRNQNLTLS